MNIIIKESKAYKYAVECVNDSTGKVGKYVKKQCAEWLELADNGYVDEKKFSKISKLLKIMIHPDLNKPMDEGLADYAQLFIYAILCTVNKDGSRHYTLGLLEIARKNFKTFTSAVIFIILMLTEPRFARLFSVAPDYKLSSELRVMVRKIILSSPLLQKHFKITRDMITCKLTDIEYTPLANSNDRMDGRLANAFLADEDGAMDSYPVEAMTSSQILLKNSLGIIISTQYPNENNDFLARVDYSKKILDKVDGTPDVGIFSLLYEPDDEIINEWEKNDNVIYQANPAAIQFPNVFEKVAQKRSMARLYDSSKENFLCKHCNIQYKGVGMEGYVSVDKVKKCAVNYPKEWWKGRNVYVGLDLSMTTDNTAAGIVTYDEERDTVVGMAKGFLPSDRVQIKSTSEKFDYQRSIKHGDCIACGDEVIDYAVVEGYILSIEEEYGCKVIYCGYDRYNAISTVQKLEGAANPIQCVEIGQHSRFLHAPTKELKERILSGKFEYIDNYLLVNNFSNARCTYDTNMNMYVHKKKSTGKVDMVVAIINAMYLLLENELRESQEIKVY